MHKAILLYNHLALRPLSRPCSHIINAHTQTECAMCRLHGFICLSQRLLLITQGVCCLPKLKLAWSAEDKNNAGLGECRADRRGPVGLSSCARCFSAGCIINILRCRAKHSLCCGAWLSPNILSCGVWLSSCGLSYGVSCCLCCRAWLHPRWSRLCWQVPAFMLGRLLLFLLVQRGLSLVLKPCRKSQRQEPCVAAERCHIRLLT